MNSIKPFEKIDPENLFYVRSGVDRNDGEIVKIDQPQKSQYKIYGHYWDSEDHALWYKNKIESIPFQIKKVLGPETELVQNIWEEALCKDEGFSPTELLTTTKIQRLTKLKEELDRLISVYGDNVALRRKHIGMGNHTEQIVVIEPAKLK